MRIVLNFQEGRIQITFIILSPRKNILLNHIYSVTNLIQCSLLGTSVQGTAVEIIEYSGPLSL